MIPISRCVYWFLSVFCFWIVREENKQQPKSSCPNVSWSQGPGEQGKAPAVWLGHFPVTALSLSPVGGGAGIKTIDLWVFLLFSQISCLITSYLIWYQIYSFKSDTNMLIMLLLDFMGRWRGTNSKFPLNVLLIFCLKDNQQCTGSPLHTNEFLSESEFVSPICSLSPTELA